MVIMSTAFTAIGIPAAEQSYAAAGQKKSVINEKVYPNGLKLVHKLNTANTIVSISAFLKNGNYYEPQDMKGITHFVQAIISRGTKTKTSEQIGELFSGSGAIFGADTAMDYAEVYMVITKPELKDMWQLFYEVISEPVFPDAEIEKERKAGIAAIKSREEEIFNVAFDNLQNLMYPGHPYSYPSIGEIGVMEKIKRDDLVNYHKNMYVPNNMLLVVVGNVSWEETQKLVDQTYAKMMKNEGLSFPKVVPVNMIENSSENVYTKKFKQGYVMRGYLAPNAMDEDYIVFKVINGILGGAMSARLFTELRDKLSLGYEVNCFFPTKKDTSQFVVYLGLDDKRVDTAKEAVEKEIEKLRSVPVSEKELKETKQHIRGSYLMSHSTNKSQAWLLGWWEMAGRGYAYDDKYLSALEKVTSEDIMRVSKKYFTNYITTVVRSGLEK